MAKHVAEEGEGRARGYEVYGIIRDLIEEGKDAEFVDKSGCYLVNWDRAIECYVDYKRKKDPDFNSRDHSRRKLSNKLRTALLSKSHKEDGAKEYSESKKRNNDDEVVKRKFQMPRKVFKFFFGNAELSDNSEEQDEQGAGKAGSSTDAGYDTMNITYGLSERVNLGSLNDPANVPGTYNQGRSSDIQMISAKPKEISTQVEGSCRIIPDSGSVKGGYEFVISYTEPLPDTVSSGMAEFEGVHKVELEKLNPYTFMGSVPASPFAHCVEVKVTSQCGDILGITSFRYFDEMVDVTRQIVQNLGEQTAFFSNMSQDPDPQNFEFQGNLDSTVQAKHKQSVKILEVLVYTAAQIGAKPFIKMIFSTSAKKTVFDSYKDRAQLPEDVARANGHCNLARYLQDITMRLTKDADEKPKTMDWLELLKAVQNQVSVSQDKESEEETTSVESDDNSSDYFADTETSSCGSFEEDDVFTFNSEGKDATEKGESKERLLEDPPYSSTPDANHLVDSKSPDNEKQNGSSFLGVIHDDVHESFVSGVCVDGAVSRDRYKKKITDVHFPEEENNKHLVTAENAAVKTNNDTASVCHLRKENHRQDLVPKKVYRTCQDPGMPPLPPTLWPCRAGETSSKRTECRIAFRIKEGKRLLMTENVVISASNFRKKFLDCSVVPNVLERLLNQEKSIWNGRFSVLLIFVSPSVGKSCFTDSMKVKTSSEATKCRGVYESKEEKCALMTENVVVSASTCRLKRPGYLVLSPLEADERQLNQEQVIFEKSIGDESVHSPSTLLPSCSVLNKSSQSSCGASLHGLFSDNVSWKNESNMKELKMERVRSWLSCNPNSEDFPSAGIGGYVFSFVDETSSEATKCRCVYESKEEKCALMTENVVVSASTCRLKRPGYLVLSPLKADERQLNQEQVIFEKSIGDEPVQLPVTLLPNCSVLNKSRPQPDNSASLCGLSSGNVSWKNESNIKELKMERVRSWLCCNSNSEEFPSAEGDGHVVSLVAASQDKESKEETTPAESVDNSSDYFANAETSSCGSFEHDDEFTSNPEGKDTAEKDFPTGESKERLLKDPPYSSIPDVNHLEDSKPPYDKWSVFVAILRSIWREATSQDKESKEKTTPAESVDNSSDYFANAETYSCGSFEHDDEFTSNPVGKDTAEKASFHWLCILLERPKFPVPIPCEICLSIAEMKAIARKFCGRCCSIVEMKEMAGKIFDTVRITVADAQFLGGSPSKWINIRGLSRYESKEEKRVLMAENVVVSASTCRLKRPGCLVVSPLKADERQLNQEQVIYEKSIGDESVHSPSTLLPSCSVPNNAPPQTDSSASLHGVSSGNVSWKNESSIKELKMARVRSLLSCNPNSEEFPSAEGDGRMVSCGLVICCKQNASA